MKGICFSSEKAAEATVAEKRHRPRGRDGMPALPVYSADFRVRVAAGVKPPAERRPT
jgi:hypothetical protein